MMFTDKKPKKPKKSVLNVIKWILTAFIVLFSIPVFCEGGIAILGGFLLLVVAFIVSPMAVYIPKLSGLPKWKQILLKFISSFSIAFLGLMFLGIQYGQNQKNIKITSTGNEVIQNSIIEPSNIPEFSEIIEDELSFSGITSQTSEQSAVKSTSENYKEISNNTNSNITENVGTSSPNINLESKIEPSTDKNHHSETSKEHSQIQYSKPESSIETSKSQTSQNEKILETSKPQTSKTESIAETSKVQTSRIENSRYETSQNQNSQSSISHETSKTQVSKVESSKEPSTIQQSTISHSETSKNQNSQSSTSYETSKTQVSKTETSKEPSTVQQSIDPNPSGNIRLISFSPVPCNPGDEVTITVQGIPNTSYSINVVYKSGKSNSKDLNPKISDSNGVVSWTWKVGTKTSLGTYPVTISSSTQKYTAQLVVS